MFKAYKEPVITHVDKTGDSEITVAISTQGIQDKYNSDDPVRRAELQQVMEAAALKFAQVGGWGCRHSLPYFLVSTSPAHDQHSVWECAMQWQVLKTL